MDKETQLWNQYASLRDEIKSTDTLCFQALGVIVAASTSIFVASLNQAHLITRVFSFLCVYLITIPGYRLLEGKRRSIWRMCTYMQIFLESELQFIKWETRLDKQRREAEKGVPESDAETNKQSFSSIVTINESFIVLGLNWSAAFAAICNVFFQPDFSWKTFIYTLVGFLLLNLILTRWIWVTERNLRRLGTVYNKFRDSWEKMYLKP